MATTADVIAGFLAQAGVRRIYGVPGRGSCLDIIEAARTRNIEFVGTQQACAAAVMAATEADLTEIPGVCVTTGGPGVSGVAVGLGLACLDRLPLIFLSGCHPRAARRIGARHHISNSQLFQGVTKESVQITRLRAERLIAWAWEKALAFPPGPIHLDLPTDEAVGPARRHALAAKAPGTPDPSPTAIRKIGRLLAGRSRAIVVAGLGCRRRDVAAALRDVIEHLGAPTFTTLRAKGVVPEDHPLSAGALLGGRIERDLLARADCVLVVGADASETLPQFSERGPTLLSMTEYSSSPSALDAAAEAVGGLAAGLALLREELPPSGEWSAAAWARSGSALKSRRRTLAADVYRVRGDGAGLPPHRVVEIAREIFPRQTLVTADTGAHTFAVAASWEAYEPKTFLCSPGGGGAPYALPAAIVGKMAAPHRPVLAFLGDAGFLASLPEVATAARLNIAITAVVFVDGSMSLARVAQEQKRYAPVGVSLGPIDIPQLAESLGALGTMVEDEDGLGSALSEAMATTKPAIIAVKVNPHGYRQLLELQGEKSGR